MHTTQAAMDFVAAVQPTVTPVMQALYKECVADPATAQRAMAYGLLLAAGEEELAIQAGEALPSCVAVAVWEYVQ